jgi:predicted transcriptional regulator
MDSQLILNIVTICISTILSIGAIILSIWFYRESNKQNKETALMQTDIKNAIEKLEHLYDRTYTDTFGALKTQLDAMQKHIFTSTVGETNISEPNNLRFYVIGCITDKSKLSIDELCNEVKGFKRAEITETIYKIHREGLIEFDGNIINYLKSDNMTPIVGQGEIK